MHVKGLTTLTDRDNAILGQKFSIFRKLEKFMTSSNTGAIFPWLEKFIRPNIFLNGPREGVKPNISLNGPYEGVSPDIQTQSINTRHTSIYPFRDIHIFIHIHIHIFIHIHNP
jgi:hypothetical protein